MPLTAPPKCTCAQPDLARLEWPEMAFVECRQCAAIEIDWHGSKKKKESQTPIRDRAVDASLFASAVGAVAVSIFAMGMP